MYLSKAEKSYKNCETAEAEYLVMKIHYCLYFSVYKNKLKKKNILKSAFWISFFPEHMIHIFKNFPPHKKQLPLSFIEK